MPKIEIMKEYTDKLKDVKFHRVFFNEESGDFKIEVISCEHEYHRVKNRIKGGTWQLRNQCLKCGNFNGNAMPQNEVNMGKVPVSIEPPYTWEEFRDERERLFERLTIAKKKKRDYYYKTKKWGKKRKLVLDRDGHKCRACEDAPATQVHHLTYKHFKNEPLFDLVSICDRCHTSISKMDKGIDYTPIKHD
jgi:hypothetical protein